MNTFYRLIVFVAFFICCSCSTDSGSEEGVMLFQNYISHQSTAEFVAKHPDFWAVTHIADSENLQQYSLEPYEMSDYLVGLMLVTFFDDRLMQVLFYTVNCEGYQDYFSTLGAVDEAAEFVYDIDHQGACYGSWSDRKLQVEYDYSVR